MHLPTEYDAGRAAPDSGNAVIGAVAFGMLALLAVGNIVGGIVVEHRAVEDSLAQTRFYWAAMGHATYLLSRTGGAGPCPNESCDEKAVMAARSQVLLDEIASLRTWQYPELGSAYRFKVVPTVVGDPLTYDAGDKGRLLFRARFEAVGGTAAPVPPQALRTVSVTRAVELRYCVADDVKSPCGGGDDQAATTSWIVSLHRPR